MGLVKVTLYRTPPKHWILKSATVSQTKSGRYFCPLSYEFEASTPAEVFPTEDNAIGLDYSFPKFYVDDQERSPDKMHWFQASEEKLAHEQRLLANIKYGSKNYNKYIYTQRGRLDYQASPLLQWGKEGFDMIAIICVDDNGGTMFNHRRQSKDRVLCEELLKLVGNNTLRMSPYSAKLFSAGDQSRIVVNDSFLDLAQPGDYCFVEGPMLAPYQEVIEEMILFKWNRVYPKDTSLDIDITGYNWELIDSFDFQGSSHEKITRERYRKKD